jgi:GNAT superfamily N-acetyltransferase
MELMVPPPTEPDDPRIRVRADATPSEWAALAASALEAEGATTLLTRLAEASGKAPEHALLYATYMGKPAGACEVSVDEGIAVIRRLGVTAPYRVRQVARALLHHACRIAFDRDAFRVLIRVFHGTGGEPLFESHGFVGMQISAEYVREFPAFLLD